MNMLKKWCVCKYSATIYLIQKPGKQVISLWVKTRNATLELQTHRFSKILTCCKMNPFYLFAMVILKVWVCICRSMYSAKGLFGKATHTWLPGKHIWLWGQAWQGTATNFSIFFQALPVTQRTPPKKKDKRMSSAFDNAPPTLSVTS